MSAAAATTRLSSPTEQPGEGPRWARRRAPWCWLVCLMVLASVTGCANLGTPNRIVLSAADLQALLNRQFPQEQRLLEVFEVRASAPELRLLPETRRVAVKLDLLARERWLGNRASGRIDFSAGLRWNAADHTVRLEQVRVQDLVMNDPPLNLPSAPSPLPPARSDRTSDRSGSVGGQGSGGFAVAGTVNDGPSTLGNSQRRSALERVGAALAERMLEDLVLHRLSGDRLARLQAAKQQPTALNITSSGLEITFSPTPP